MFEIVGTVLYLKAGAVLDYQTDPVLDVTVAVDDVTVGGTPDGTAALSIVVIDKTAPGADIVDVTPDPRTTRSAAPRSSSASRSPGSIKRT